MTERAPMNERCDAVRMKRVRSSQGNALNVRQQPPEAKQCIIDYRQFKGTHGTFLALSMVVTMELLPWKELWIFPKFSEFGKINFRTATF